MDSKSIEDNIQIPIRSMSDPPLSDIVFQNKMAGALTTLKISSFKILPTDRTID